MEAATGIVLLIDPTIVSRLLLGAELSGVGAAVGRCFGIAVIALGLACWPARRRGEDAAAAVRAMATYNVLIGLYLGYLGMTGPLGGPLLWPAVVLHVVVGLWLAGTRRGGSRAGAAGD